MTNVWIAVIVLVFAALMYLMLDERSACTEGGGIYVRTMFGFECMQVTR
jgi:hypothetical protein